MPTKYTGSIYDPAPVAAIYTPQVNPMHWGNPCIEALENHLEPSKIVELTGSFAPYDPDFRNLENRFDRMSILKDLIDVLRIPLTTDVALFIQTRQLISSVCIRNHVLSPHYWADVPPLFIAKQRYIAPNHRLPDLYGFLVWGDSGSGKSTSLEQLRSVLRQLILHEIYQDETLVLRQIPMLIVRCPGSGAIGAFLGEILSAVDAILHDTNYYDRYAKKAHDLTAVKKGVKVVCRNHNIGVIFVDEAQNLIKKNAPELVSYLARFNETVNVPLVLVGTPDVKDIWKQSFSAGRRLSGSGPIELNRLPLSSHEESPLYKFCVKLGRYQLTRTITPITADIVDALGRVSGGNPDQLKRAWIYVQSRAIEFGNDNKPLTPQDILVIKGKFTTVDRAIELIAQRDWAALHAAFSDVNPHEVVFIPPKAKDPKVPANDKAKVNEQPNSPEMPLATDINPPSISDTEPNRIANPLLKKAKRARKTVEKKLTGSDDSKTNEANSGTNGYDELNDQGIIGF